MLARMSSHFSLQMSILGQVVGIEVRAARASILVEAPQIYSLSPICTKFFLLDQKLSAVISVSP